jgi:hypothetical protein
VWFSQLSADRINRWLLAGDAHVSWTMMIGARVGLRLPEARDAFVP